MAGTWNGAKLTTLLRFILIIIYIILNYPQFHLILRPYVDVHNNSIALINDTVENDMAGG
jgi:hypothetical protein